MSYGQYSGDEDNDKDQGMSNAIYSLVPLP